MGASAAGLALTPTEGFAHLLSAKEWAAVKGEKVKMAYIGIGNQGAYDIEQFEKTGMVEVVALCDIDLDGKQCQKVLAKYPKAKRFRDFREMFDKAGNEFDAVLAAVPDHAHFPICMLALRASTSISRNRSVARSRKPSC